MDWWETLFNEDYLKTYGDITDAKTTHRQVDFLESYVGQLTLDLACGQGRHTHELMRRGHFTTGLDYSSVLLAEAQKGEGLFLQGDMRALPFLDNSFNTVLCLMSSFGYFRDENDHMKVIEEAYRVLKPGGYFLLDLKSPYFNHEGSRVDTLSNGLVVKTVDRKEGDRWVTIREWNGQRYESSIRIFSSEEVTKLFSRFSTIELKNGYSNTPFTEESKRMMIVAKKGAS